MKSLLECRRTFVATLAILALFSLGFWKGADVALSIAGVVGALAGANAAEAAVVGKAKAENGPPVEPEQEG